jgi:hypothetical protein
MMSRLALNERNARFWQLVLLVVILVGWHLASRNQQVAFFLGEPIQVAGRIWSWFLPFEVPANPLFPTGSRAMPTSTCTWAPRCSRPCWPSASAPCWAWAAGCGSRSRPPRA